MEAEMGERLESANSAMRRPVRGLILQTSLSRTIAAVALCSFLIFLPLIGAYAQVSVSSINVSHNESTSISPRVAVSGNNVYAVWQDSLTGGFEVFFAASTDGGSTFGEPVNIGNTGGPAASPKIAAGGSNVYVIWQDSSSGPNEIFFTSSNDSGITFASARNISQDGVSATFGEIAVSNDDSDKVFVVWTGVSSGNGEIYFTSSIDGGGSFADPVNISQNEGESTTPQLALSTNATVFVTWIDSTPGNFEIFFSSGANGNFTEPVNVSESGANAASPKIATSGESTVSIVWADDSAGSGDIFHVASSDSGATFSDPFNISDNEGSSLVPLLARSDPDNIFVSWQDSTDNDFAEIFFSSSTGGQPFTDPVNISVSPEGPSFALAMEASDDDDIFVAWTDGSVNFINEIFFASSLDGDDFGCPINLSANPGSSATPRIVTQADGLPLVIWQDQDDLGNSDILLKVFDPHDPTVTLDLVSNTVPLWDLDSVEVAGGVGNGAPGDTVTIDWGDGTLSEGVEIDGCSWGPVSHSFALSSISDNPLSVSAKLIAGDDSERAQSSETQVNVQQHFTSLTLDPIASVTVGTEVTVTGVLVDGATGLGISGQSISFDGTGAATNIADAVTDADGIFSSSGNATSETQDHLQVQAHYAGDEGFSPSDSNAVSYDTVELDAVQFNVTAGENVNVDISGFFAFNGSITFDSVEQDGHFFASECDAPASARYSATDICLRVSSAVDMADGTLATVELLYSGDLAPGSSPTSLSLFHEEFTGSEDDPVIVDITSGRDPGSESVSGRTGSFSKFILGTAIHEAKPVGAHRQEVFVGSSNEVGLRDITSLQNSSATATASFDKEVYKRTDPAVLMITDDNGDVNSTEIDIVQAMVKSETSAPFGMEIVLIETQPASGVFDGTFEFTSGESSSENLKLQAKQGDKFSVGYLSGGRFAATIDGLEESGFAQMSDYVVESSVCMKPVGGAVNLELVDAHLGSSGLISASLSYANADLRGFDPSNFRLVQLQDATWIDITQSVDLDAMTVSGVTSVPGPFTIAVDLDDCTGGAGGGLGRPGSGLVVDFVASLAVLKGGGGGGGSSSEVKTASPAQTVQAGEGSAVNAQAQVGADSIDIVFDEVTSEGSIYIKELTDSDFPSGAFTATSAQEQTMVVDGSEAHTVGKIYDITVSSGFAYDGSIHLTMHYENSTQEENLRLLHFANGSWEDVTTSANYAADTITGELTTLSPVAITSVADGTYGSLYHENHALSKVSAADISFVDGAGNKIGEVGTGGVGLAAEFKNVQRISQPYSAIVQVLDEEGIAVNISWSSGTMDKGSQTSVTVMPDLSSLPSGTYTFQFFVVSSVDGENIELLTPAQELAAQLD